MSTIDSVQHPRQVKNYSAGLRVWHWSSVLVISGSLITILINATLNDRSNITPVIVGQLKSAGIAVSSEQAGKVGHALSDKLWAVHTYLGYGLATLFLFRLVLEAFQLVDQKLIRKLKVSYNSFAIKKIDRVVARHHFFVKIIYLVFYVLLMIMVVTGLFLAFEDLLAPFKAIRHSVKEVHGFCMYLILSFIAVHLAGVFLAERGDQKGIVSDMINGGQVL